MEDLFGQPVLADYVWVRAAAVMGVVLALLMVLVAQKIDELWWWSWAFAVLEVGTATVFAINAAFGVPEGADAWPFWALAIVNGGFGAGLLVGMGIGARRSRSSDGVHTGRTNSTARSPSHSPGRSRTIANRRTVSNARVASYPPSRGSGSSSFGETVRTSRRRAPRSVARSRASPPAVVRCPALARRDATAIHVIVDRLVVPRLPGQEAHDLAAAERDDAALGPHRRGAQPTPFLEPEVVVEPGHDGVARLGIRRGQFSGSSRPVTTTRQPRCARSRAGPRPRPS